MEISCRNDSWNCVWSQKLEGLTVEGQPEVYLKESGPGSHHIGFLKIVCNRHNMYHQEYYQTNRC